MHPLLVALADTSRTRQLLYTARKAFYLYDRCGRPGSTYGPEIHPQRLALGSAGHGVKRSPLTISALGLTGSFMPVVPGWRAR